MERIDIFIPLTGSSPDAPGKNMRPFGGRPLFHTILATLQRAERIGTVHIDTDSDIVAEAAAEFDEVEVVRRKQPLCGHDVSVNRLIREFLVDRPGIQHLGQTNCNNPLLQPATIDAAIEAYFNNADATSLFTVTALQARLYDKDLHAINHDSAAYVPSRELDPIYVENSNLYLFERDAFLERDSRITSKPMVWPMERYEAVQIEDERDFRMAEALHRGMNLLQP